MAKCFVTGVEMPMERAYVLDQGAARHELRRRRESLAALQRMLDQYTPSDNIEVFDRTKRQSVAKRQKRLVCESVACALNGLCPETPLFISWEAMLDRHKVWRQRQRTASLKQFKGGGAAASTGPEGPARRSTNPDAPA